MGCNKETTVCYSLSGFWVKYSQTNSQQSLGIESEQRIWRWLRRRASERRDQGKRAMSRRMEGRRGNERCSERGVCADWGSERSSKGKKCFEHHETSWSHRTKPSSHVSWSIHLDTEVKIMCLKLWLCLNYIYRVEPLGHGFSLKATLESIERLLKNESLWHL